MLKMWNKSFDCLESGFRKIHFEALNFQEEEEHRPFLVSCR